MSSFIEVRNLTFFYSGTENGIKNISFSMSKGESLAIIGPNGSGKTTLLYSICGLLKAKGEVFIDGMRVGAGADKVREKIGFVFQDPDDQLFMPTVLQDVGFFLAESGMEEREIEGRVREVLEAVGLKGFENRETHKLSFGEKKKVCIASSLIHNPEVLIFDEPTSGLDPKGRRELIKLIKQIDKTLIIASHDLEAISDLTERVMVMKAGMKIAEGKTEEILNDKNILKEIEFLE